MPVDRTALCGAKAEADAIRSAERRYTNLMVAVMRRSDFRIHLCGAPPPAARPDAGQTNATGRTPDRQNMENKKQPLQLEELKCARDVDHGELR